jgi:hypothetical protein
MRVDWKCDSLRGRFLTWFTARLQYIPKAWERLLSPRTGLQELVPATTQRFPKWSRGRRAHNLMNSIQGVNAILTSEV